MSDLVTRLTWTPARILGIDAGTLTPGSSADICIFDPQYYWTLTTQNIVSNGHNTPFLDWELKGMVMHTLFGGKIIHSHDHETSD